MASYKQEILGQYRVLGVPTEEELQGSDNVIWVDAYTRDDGTEVRGHWRSKPNGGGVNDRVNNEDSYKTKNETSTGGAAQIKQEQTPLLEATMTKDDNRLFLGQMISKLIMKY